MACHIFLFFSYYRRSWLYIFWTADVSRGKIYVSFFDSTAPRLDRVPIWLGKSPAASELGNQLHYGGLNDNIMFVRKLNICGTLYACSRIEIHQTWLWSMCTTGRCNTFSIGRLPLSSPIFRHQNKSDFELWSSISKRIQPNGQHRIRMPEFLPDWK